MGLLTDPFRYPFMQHALLAAVLVGLTCAVLGAYVVPRRMAFVGDALAHTTLPGLVVAHLFGWSLSLGGLTAAVAAALIIGWVSRRQAIKEDTAIGVVFTGMFALGVLLMSRLRSFRDLSHMLFGNVLGVTTGDLWLIAGVAVVVLITVLLFHKELELTCFDTTHAEVIGIRSDRLRYLLLVLLALAVVTGIQAVGVVLTNALLVTPAATAALLTDRFHRRLALASLLAVVCCAFGLWASYHLEASSGASMVLACTAAFVVAGLGRSAWLRLRRRPSSAVHPHPEAAPMSNRVMIVVGTVLFLVASPAVADTPVQANGLAMLEPVVRPVFPGFSAEVEVRLDGITRHGRLIVGPDGHAHLEHLDEAAARWAWQLFHPRPTLTAGWDDRPQPCRRQVGRYWRRGGRFEFLTEAECSAAGAARSLKVSRQALLSKP